MIRSIEVSMESFFKSLKRQDGFTLVELMVVVAIIGLLSAVAIPNFKKYQAKAKTSEAKLQLSAAYTAEQSFYSDYNLYHHCLNYMGYNPSNESAQRYFAIGFKTSNLAAAGAPLAQAVANGLITTTAACPTAITDGQSRYEATKKLTNVNATIAIFDVNAAGAAAILGTQADPANETFVIGAVGPVDSKFITNTTMAGFTINQNKIISHVVMGY